MVLLAALALLTGCGGGNERADAPITTMQPQAGGVERIVVGRGADTAVIYRPRGVRLPPGVVFLHGWGGMAPRLYGAWIDHLVARGNEVIFPIYQETPLQNPRTVLGHAVNGVRAALRRAPIRPGSLVVAGHSAGGALSADYAAVAQREGLPRPRAILAVYPGRMRGGIPLTIPEADARGIAPDTRIVALAGADDAVVGTETARRIAAAPAQVPVDRRSYVLVRDPAVDDHLAPLRTDDAARRAFWGRLDRLMEQARRRHE